MTITTADVIMGVGLLAGLIVVFMRIEHRFTKLEVILSRLPCILKDAKDALSGLCSTTPPDKKF